MLEPTFKNIRKLDRTKVMCAELKSMLNTADVKQAINEQYLKENGCSVYVADNLMNVLVQVEILLNQCISSLTQEYDDRVSISKEDLKLLELAKEVKNKFSQYELEMEFANTEEPF